MYTYLNFDVIPLPILSKLRFKQRAEHYMYISIYIHIYMFAYIHMYIYIYTYILQYMYKTYKFNTDIYFYLFIYTRITLANLSKLPGNKGAEHLVALERCLGLK